MRACLALSRCGGRSILLADPVDSDDVFEMLLELSCCEGGVGAALEVAVAAEDVEFCLGASFTGMDVISERELGAVRKVLMAVER